MKKRISKIISGMLVFISIIPTSAGVIPKVNLNNTKVLMLSNPLHENGRTYIPLRSIAENLGVEVQWNNAAQQITIIQGTNTISCEIGSNIAVVNNEEIKIDVSPRLKAGTTYVPLRFVADYLGAVVNFDKATNTIDIKYDLPADQKYDYLGRKIRKTNLPKNAIDYAYILESVPNEMYEMKPTYQLKKYIKPVDVQKIYPKYNEKALDVFKKIIEKNLDTRLNVSYKTADAAWAKDLKSTYFENKHKDIDSYTNYIKNNKLTIEGDYFVEPSTTYYWLSPVMRCWVKFMIKSDTVKEASLYQMGLVNVKINTLYQGYVDIRISSQDGGNILENFRIKEDFISGDANVKEMPD